MKILLISDFFPPYNCIGSVRAGKTAKYLCEFGHDIKILTARHDQFHDQTLPIEVPRENIYTVEVRRFSDYAGTNYNSVSKLRKIIIRIRVFLKTFNFLSFAKDDSLFWYWPAVKVGKCLVENWEPDVIISSALPITCHMIAARIGKTFWVAEYRDLWSGGPGARVSGIDKIFFPIIENWILKKCNLIITVSNPLGEYLRKKYLKPTEVVFNGFDHKEINFTQLSKDSYLKVEDRDKLIINYLGSIYEGRSIKPLLEAISRNEVLKMSLLINLYTDSNPSLSSQISQYQLESCIKISERVSYSESMLLQSNSDILLFISYSSAFHEVRGVLSGKAFEYLGAHRPILSIGSNKDHPLIRENLMRHCSSVEEITDQLFQWVNEKKEFGVISFQHNPGDLVKWTREFQTRRLEKMIYKLCGFDNNKVSSS